MIVNVPLPDTECVHQCPYWREPLGLLIRLIFWPFSQNLSYDAFYAVKACTCTYTIQILYRSRDTTWLKGHHNLPLMFHITVPIGSVSGIALYSELCFWYHFTFSAFQKDSEHLDNYNPTLLKCSKSQSPLFFFFFNNNKKKHFIQSQVCCLINCCAVIKCKFCCHLWADTHLSLSLSWISVVFK